MQDNRQQGEPEKSHNVSGASNSRSVHPKHLLKFIPKPQDKMLELTEFKSSAEDKWNLMLMMISVIDRISNSVGKGKKKLPAFSPVPTVKNWDML